MHREEKLTMKISEIHWEIVKDFGFNLSMQRLRRLESDGLSAPRRGSNEYRVYGLPDIKRLKTVIALAELGISRDGIKDYLSGNKEVLAERIEVLDRLESYLVNN